MALPAGFDLDAIAFPAEASPFGLDDLAFVESAAAEPTTTVRRIPLTGRRDNTIVITGRRDNTIVITGRRDNTIVITGSV